MVNETPASIVVKIIECFYKAHCKDLALNEKNADSSKEYCREIVTKAFFETGGDINSPTKESIISTLDWLAKFSKNFRTDETVQKNYNEIMEYVNSLED